MNTSMYSFLLQLLADSGTKCININHSEGSSSVDVVLFLKVLLHVWEFCSSRVVLESPWKQLVQKKNANKRSVTYERSVFF